MKSLSQMTEEELKTLCKSLEERYGENSTVTLKQSDFNKMWASIDRYAKENKCLQEQLADASKTIDYYDKKDFHYTLADGTVMGAEPAHKYKIKWGVK